MKQLLSVLLIQFLLCQQSFAQTSQLPKEMIEQIVALKTFLLHLKKGYQIVHNGLQTVNRIKNGDFSLHQFQIDKLQHVSPAAKKTAAIYGTAISQASLILHCRQLLRQLPALSALTKEEQNFCSKTIQRMLDACQQIIDDFLQLVTAGELELKEEERINRILSVRQQTMELAASVRSLEEQLLLLSRNRELEQRSVDHSKQVNALK